MKTNKLYKVVLLMSAIVASTSCSFLDTEPQIIEREGYYTDESRLLYGLAGVYGVLSSEALYGNYYSLQVCNADDLCWYNNNNNAESRPDRYNHTAGTAVIYEIWLKLYAGIKNANEYLDALETVDIPSSKLSVGLETYRAEARFLRAYYHFLLAQAWGDVPMRVKSVKSPNPSDVQMAATPQEKILKWCVDEIEAVVGDLSEDVDITPSRVSRTVAQGILARIYLFMAGATVADVDGLSKAEMYVKAAYWAGEVIASKRHSLNPSYEQVFINMISDEYDGQYHESMWEAEFLGDRTSSSFWSNGRIGDLIGLKSQAATTNYSEWACNYSYGYYNGSYTLWQLYWDTNRTDSDKARQADKDISAMDKRMLWNLPGYNYRGFINAGGNSISIGGGETRMIYQPRSMYKTPWNYQNNFAMPEPIEGLDMTIENAFDPAVDPWNYDPQVMCSVRNAGKWRRETVYEKQMSAKNLYTTINFPILRYSDVLLMYAEAVCERDGAPDEEARQAVLEVRNRAGVETEPVQLNDPQLFRELLRNERARELAFEGLRKWDLIRWGIFVRAMHNAGTYVSTVPGQTNKTLTDFAATTYESVVDRHIYLPVPSKELAVNHALRQNPLW